MKTTESTCQSAGNLHISYRVWSPDQGPARATVLLVHGIAEHAGRYVPLAQHLTGRGYRIYAPDHRGHGRSEGQKGYVERLDYIVDDLKTMLDIISSTALRDGDAESSRSKVFVYGHSLGGLLAIHLAIRYQDRLAGAILSAASIMIGSAVPPAMKAVSRILSVVAPKTPVQELKSTWLCHDPDVIRDYDTDPLNYRGKVMARSGAELMSGADWALANIPSIRIPVLCLHGGADPLVDPAGTQYLYDHVASTDKTIRIFDGLYHEIHNEYERETVYAVIGDWLDQH